MRKWLIAVAVLLWGGSSPAQEKVVIGGSGALLNLMPQLVQGYQARYPSDSVEIVKFSMSTTGGIEGTKIGRFNVGLVSLKPTDQEKGNLVYRVIARAPVVVAVNKSVTLSNLTEAEVCSLFSGKVKSWKELGGPEQKIQVLGRVKDDANMEAMRKQMACFASVNLPPDAVLLNRGNEVDQALSHRAGTAAVTDMESAMRGRESFKALSIDGVSPMAESTASARYPYTREFGVVTAGEPQATVKRFLDFLGGPESQKVFAQSGVLAARSK